MAPLAQAYRELADLVARHTHRDGENETPIEHLFLSRTSAPSQPLRAAQWPCFALVAQGAKSLSIGRDVFSYGVGDFLVVSLDLPVISRVTRATSARPNLGIGLAIDRDRLASVLARLDVRAVDRSTPPALCVAVNRASSNLLEATLRLLRLLGRPRDIPALAPLVEEEILYWLLMSPAGPSLLRVARGNTAENQIVSAARWVREHLAKDLRIVDLSARVGMSPSSLHHHFKATTGLSPLQYQKQLRLNEARRLLLVEGLDVASAGYRVGYRSASQFSREYARLHGLPPRRDVARDTS
ncbi:MAG: Transcriptional regulator, AraC family protein [Myxococcaceae bacterium]|nr:Transcriptional regulator, AraC family protein [Myxococcaceae bacterium]